MLFSTIGQIHAFMWMTGAGLVIGALYMLCSCLRRLMCSGLWLTLIIDALFGLSAALILIAAALTASYGSLRLYELLGAALGAILFELGMRPPLEWLTGTIQRRLHKVLQKIATFRLIKVIFK